MFSIAFFRPRFFFWYRQQSAQYLLEEEISSRHLLRVGLLSMQDISYGSRRRIYLLQCPQSSYSQIPGNSHWHAEEVIYKVLLEYISREMQTTESEFSRQFITVLDSQVCFQAGKQQSKAEPSRRGQCLLHASVGYLLPHPLFLSLIHI